jgi:putative thioredoxin
VLNILARVIHDVDEAAFPEHVIERSREVPVVVDFWAAWCGPCRALTPALEAATKAREGKVDLAKVDVDANQLLAQAFEVRGIPAVKAFRNGQIAGEFTGAIPPPEVERFFDSLLPSEADQLAELADEESLRRALELDPGHAPAAVRLGRLLLSRGDAAGARELLEPFEHDFAASGLAARAALMDAEDVGLARAFAALDEGDHESALELLQEALADADEERRDLLRRVMVGIFTELGPHHELARAHRRRLAAALS